MIKLSDDQISRKVELENGYYTQLATLTTNDKIAFLFDNMVGHLMLMASLIEEKESMTLSRLKNVDLYLCVGFCLKRLNEILFVELISGMSVCAKVWRELCELYDRLDRCGNCNQPVRNPIYLMGAVASIIQSQITGDSIDLNLIPPRQLEWLQSLSFPVLTEVQPIAEALNNCSENLVVEIQHCS